MNTNAERCERGLTAITGYVRHRGGLPGQDDMRNLITDLLHFWHMNGRNPFWEILGALRDFVRQCEEEKNPSRLRVGDTESDRYGASFELEYREP